jgi:hypothetical protein
VEQPKNEKRKEQTTFSFDSALQSKLVAEVQPERRKVNK